MAFRGMVGVVHCKVCRPNAEGMFAAIDPGVFERSRTSFPPAMPFLSRRVLLMFCAVAISVFSSGWMFFGSGALSLGLSASDVLWSHRPSALIHSPLLSILPNFASQNLPVPGTLKRPLLQHNVANVQDDHMLGVASNIYVVSLPHRTDRRAAMERLKQALELDWTYVDAVPSGDPSIVDVLERVRRTRFPPGELQDDLPQQFAWPDILEIDALVHSSMPLDLAGSDIWAKSPDDTNFFSDSSVWPPNKRGLEQSLDDLDGILEAHLPETAFGPDIAPLTCATRNNITGPEFTPSLPPYMILTPAKVACWMSHLEVIRRIANSVAPDTLASAPSGNAVVTSYNPLSRGVGIVLEDDIDMERDIQARLQDVWTALPSEWDVVFLGHCWSDESYYPALPPSPSATSKKTSTNLHPSFAPKCTHAYALTRAGARRLLLHLRHPPFAYSRAIDQAMSWLIQSGRLRAFSAVPSLIVQRKVAESDIDSGNSGIGSLWREHLENGVLGS